MFTYQSSKIWKKSLAEQKGNDAFKKERERLRISFENFRQKAATLASEIPQDLKEFTVHDVTHLDALWEMIDIVTDDSFQLNPAEAYVLGGAILTHDLGLALAAYPDGLEELKKDIFWSDTIVALYQEKENKDPTSEEIAKPDEAIERAATKILLRHYHAKRAETLAVIHWNSKSHRGEVYYLIEDAQLRESYGKIIGMLAHSHWWTVDDISNKFSEIGAATCLPNEWSVDTLKIACLLRIADAIHIDDRRAPEFLWAVRELNSESNQHWNFQNKLFKPKRTTSNRLLYTTKSPFRIEEVESWWLCYDSLKMIDDELSKVDSLLGESGRQRLLVWGVEFIDNPQKLAKHIQTEGWEPVDTKIKVGNVASLVQRLGGVELYGDDMLIPLREMIQNSCDAVRARRLIESKSKSWGSITISEGANESGRFIEIEDNGVGMSPKVLTGPFLDFGQSFWNTGLLLDELPGLKTKKFKSTGKYGIGFFSVFMWGDKVKIVSRKYNQSLDETWSLEFKGLNSRPILRKADPEDKIVDGGTRITVWFRGKEDLKELVFGFDSLDEMCRYVAPAIDANFSVKDESGRREIIEANDWLNMPYSRLITRVALGSDSGGGNYEEKNLGKTTDLILNADGKVVGRGFISWYHNHPGFGITTNGIRTGDKYDDDRENSGTFHGIIEGVPLNAARSNNQVNLSQLELDSWVTNQVKKISQLKIPRKERIWYALSAISLGGSPLDLPFIAQSINQKIRFLNYPEIVKKFRAQEYCVIKDVDFYNFKFREFQTGSFGINIDTHSYHYQKIIDHIQPYETGRHFSRNTGLYWVEKALLEAWDVKKLNIQYFDGDEYQSKQTVARLSKELKKIGITKKFRKIKYLGYSQNFIAIAKRM